jgi:hypothetical protein
MQRQANKRAERQADRAAGEQLAALLSPGSLRPGSGAQQTSDAGGNRTVAAVGAALELLLAVLPPPRSGLPDPRDLASAADAFLVAWRELREVVQPEELSETERAALARHVACGEARALPVWLHSLPAPGPPSLCTKLTCLSPTLPAAASSC